MKDFLACCWNNFYSAMANLKANYQLSADNSPLLHIPPAGYSIHNYFYTIDYIVALFFSCFFSYNFAGISSPFCPSYVRPQPVNIENINTKNSPIL